MRLSGRDDVSSRRSSLLVLADLRSSSSGLEETSHILNSEHVNSLLDELVDQVEVVLEGVLGLLGVGEISRVADGSLDDSSGLLGSVDTELHVLDVVEGARKGKKKRKRGASKGEGAAERETRNSLEHPEDIESVLDGSLGELVDSVIGVRGVSDGVGSSNESLEGDVGNQLSEGSLLKERRREETRQVSFFGTTREGIERASLSQGSSYKNLIATSKVAPPQHSNE